MKMIAVKIAIVITTFMIFIIMNTNMRMMSIVMSIGGTIASSIDRN